MPHTARKRSESGFYHVVPKGIADQILFEDDFDRALYVRLLAESKQESGIRLHAYCLMSNHTHLIVEDPDARISDAMKYVHERYAMAFANKTNRIGGILRKPYWSEPIENEAYLLCAVRYVHANPAHAGICAASAYDWSSAKDYLGREGIADTRMVLDMCGGREGFVRFSQPKNVTALPFCGSKLRNHLSDDEALRMAISITGMNPSVLPSLDKSARAEIVQLLVRRGFTPSRIARLSGLGRGQVRSCLT